MGGEEFLRALRQEVKTPVVLMTGTTSRGTSWLAGADAYLPKPFNPGDLEAAIKVALRTK
jgi:DNA-binding response OmpR family regulator